MASEFWKEKIKRVRLKSIWRNNDWNFVRFDKRYETYRFKKLSKPQRRWIQRNPLPDTNFWKLKTKEKRSWKQQDEWHLTYGEQQLTWQQILHQKPWRPKESDMFSSAGRKDLSSPILHPESNLQKQTGKSRPLITSRPNLREWLTEPLEVLS